MLDLSCLSDENGLCSSAKGKDRRRGSLNVCSFIVIIIIIIYHHHHMWRVGHAEAPANNARAVMREISTAVDPYPIIQHLSQESKNRLQFRWALWHG